MININKKWVNPVFPEERDFPYIDGKRRAVCKRCNCVMVDFESLHEGGGGEYTHPELDKKGKSHWCKNAGLVFTHGDSEIVPYVRKRDRKRFK